MTPGARVLADLAAHGVLVELGPDGCLSVRGRGPAPPPELVADLRRLREEVLAELQRLPLLALYRDASGAPWESWLLAEEAGRLVPPLVRLGARVSRAVPWTRADLPRGAVPADLVRDLVELHRGRLRLPTPAELAERLALEPEAGEPARLPDTCPACRVAAGWALLESGRHLCRRCWSASGPGRAPPVRRAA